MKKKRTVIFDVVDVVGLCLGYNGTSRLGTAQICTELDDEFT